MTKLASGFDQQIKKEFVKALTRNHEAELNEIESSGGFVTSNGRSLEAWNYIFADLAKIVKEHNLTYGIIDKGLWSSVIIFSKDKKQALLFFNEGTLRRVTSNLDSNPVHYLNALLVKNNVVGSYEQQNLLENSQLKNIDKKRREEAQLLLKQDYEKVETVYVLSKKSIQGVAIKAQIDLFDSAGHLLKTEDLSEFINIDYAIEGVEQNSKVSSTIPKLKSHVIKKADDGTRIVQKKEDKQDETPNE